MITIHQDVDFGAQTVTWRLEVTEPEHDIAGRMCHAVDVVVLDDRLRGILRSLGYEHVACLVKRESPGWPETHVEYWWHAVKPEREPDR